jgi:hypothetical protein
LAIQHITWNLPALCISYYRLLNTDPGLPNCYLFPIIRSRFKDGSFKWISVEPEEDERGGEKAEKE